MINLWLRFWYMPAWGWLLFGCVNTAVYYCTDPKPTWFYVPVLWFLNGYYIKWTLEELRDKYSK